MSRLKGVTSNGADANRYAAIYCRVSTDEQVKGFSIPTQKEACQKLAAREGYTVPESHVLTDEGISGTTLDRPGLRRLRELVQTRAIAAAIVYDPDRLSRNLGHQLLLAEEFERGGVTLLIVSHPLEQGPEGWLFFQMRGALAEYERAKILERTKRGMLGRAKAGHVHGGNVPLGYRYVAGDHTGYVEIDEEEAAVVRAIFDLCLSGMASKSIARRLTEARIPTKRDRQPSHGRGKSCAVGVWNHDSVHRVLTNEAYIGRLYWNKRRRVTKTTTATRVREEWVEISIPPIVSADIFTAVRAQLDQNKALARRNRKRDYLFIGGRLRCGRCGRAMIGFAPKNRRRYRCSSLNNLADRAQYCRGSANAAVVESQVWAAVERFLQDPDQVAAMVAQQQASAEAQREAIRRDMAPIASALVKCDEKDRRLIDAYMVGAFTAAELKAYRADIEARRQSLLAQQAEAQARLDAIGQAVDHVEALIDYCARVRQALQTFDAAEKRLAFQALNVRVTWRPGEPLGIEGDIPLGDIAPITTRCDRNAASGARHRPHIGRRRAASPPPGPLSGCLAVAGAAESGASRSYPALQPPRV